MKTLQVLMEGMLNLQQSRLQLGKFLGAVLDLGAEGQEALQNLNITSYFLTVLKLLLKMSPAPPVWDPGCSHHSHSLVFETVLYHPRTMYIF